MKRNLCSERPASSVWVAVEVTVAGVSHSDRERPAGRGLQSAPHGFQFGAALLQHGAPWRELDDCRWSQCYSSSRPLAGPAQFLLVWAFVGWLS